MQTSISSRSDSIQVVYDNYLQNRYVVNRRYQRKLVWTLEEKVAFIDSIHKQYSVPLFLLAQTGTAGEQKFEIIDGMQRLNAVVSFIENEFPIEFNGKKHYFDLDTLASSKNLADKQLIKQKTPKLPRQECIDIVSYQMPFTSIIAEQKDIEEIFRRINSFGKQLSSQEIRQAGALGIFSDMVRELSSKIRGDVSISDSVLLNQMKFISLSNSSMGYGIDVNNLFWVRQHIIPVKNMRTSRDEELIAWILAYMIIGKDAQPTSKALDRLYKYETGEDMGNDATLMEAAINRLSKKVIKQWFCDTFVVLLDILMQAQKDFRTLIFSETEAEGLVRTFQVIFLALFELVIRDHMVIADILTLIKTLDGIGRKHLSGISNGAWDADQRYQRILAIKGIIEPHFKPKTGEDVATENWTLELDNIMRLSTIENGQYDFKTGIHTFSDGTLNVDLVKKIIKTLTAAVNKAPETNGYVIIGVAEGADTLRQYQTFYHSKGGKKFENTKFYITGIDDEVNRFYDGKTESYLNEIINIIKKEPIEESTIQYILTHIKLPRYQDRNILVLHLKSNNTPVTYNDEYYVRSGNSNNKITGVSGINALQQRFSK